MSALLPLLFTLSWFVLLITISPWVVDKFRAITPIHNFFLSRRGNEMPTRITLETSKWYSIFYVSNKMSLILPQRFAWVETAEAMKWNFGIRREWNQYTTLVVQKQHSNSLGNSTSRFSTAFFAPESLDFTSSCVAPKRKRLQKRKMSDKH